VSASTIRWRYFLVYQDRMQEAWLQAQARRGLHLARPGLFGFTFAQGEPRDEAYRIDFQTLRGHARDEYLGLFRDAGWDFLGQVANRYYFRARPDALSSEILTDAESRMDRIRRQMQVGAILTSGPAFLTSIGMSQLFRRLAAPGPHSSIGAPILIITLAGAFTALGVWCLWQMEQVRKREK
jgi:hypothetical protein